MTYVNFLCENLKVENGNRFKATYEKNICFRPSSIIVRLTHTDRHGHLIGEASGSRIASNRPTAHVSMRGFQPRRTFLKKQQEEHTLGLILIGMSSLFIFCQSFKIIPDLYELVVCNHAGNLGHNCAISKVPAMNIITRFQLNIEI